MEENRGKTLMLSIVGVATLLVAIVGATFAYFSISVNGNENASSIVVQTTQLTNITFVDGPEIRLENIYPGQGAHKTFTISTGSEKITDPIELAVSLQIDENGFTQIPLYDELGRPIGVASTDLVDWFTCPANTVTHTCRVYERMGTSEATAEPIEVLSGVRELAYVTFLPGAQSDSITLGYDILFMETNEDQNYAQGRTFGAQLFVDTVTAGKYTAYGSIWYDPNGK